MNNENEAYLQHRLTEIDNNDWMEQFVNRAIKVVVTIILISLSVIAWLIYTGVTT